jgi:hypothetical protein
MSAQTTDDKNTHKGSIDDKNITTMRYLCSNPYIRLDDVYRLIWRGNEVSLWAMRIPHGPSHGLLAFAG